MATQIVDGFLGAVGGTPLIALKKIAPNLRIFAKAEFCNPAGSVKDRPAAALARAAAAALASATPTKEFPKTVVEATAGNTGIALTHAANALGLRTVLFVPDSQSPEKLALVRALGADLRLVPAVPLDSPNHYTKIAAAFAKATPNSFYAAQFDNTINRDAHTATTGPEIWKQTAGTVDAFICAAGTGGTIAGIAKALKAASNGRTRIVLADPPGSALFRLVKNGVLERTGTASITEGIGQGRITGNLNGALDLIDDAIHVPDETTIATLYKLLHLEGLFVGASSALNIAAAIELAQTLGPHKTVVTILCDGAYRYQSRIFSRSWLESKNLISAIPQELHRYIALP